MKTQITTLLVILATALSATAQADKVKRSAEQQVLDRFPGEWTYLLKNPAGEVLLDMSAKVSRESQ